MGCADACLDMDYDSSSSDDFHRERVVKSRGYHVCCECQRAILPEQEYERASGKSDGYMWTAKTCISCYRIRRVLVCGSYVYGRLWEEIREAIFPIWNRYSPIDCLAKLDEKIDRDRMMTEYREWRG